MNYNNYSNIKLLLPNSFRRKSFDLYNIIRLYFEKSAIIFSAEDSSKARKASICYRSKVHILDESNINKFTIDLDRIVADYQVDKIVFLPVEESSTQLFLSYICNSGIGKFRFSLPDRSTFELASDKLKLNKYCLKIGVPAPKYYDSIPEINKENFKPIIVKPRKGEGAKGHFQLNQFEDLSKIDKNDIKYKIIQEIIQGPNEVEGAFFLCDKGNVISSYSHKRIRTFPKKGGVSVFSRVTENHDIINAGKELLKKMKWSGFAMIEFKKDVIDQKYKIIEINPRIWGSFLLSEFAKKNFFIDYVNLSLGFPLAKANTSFCANFRWFVLDLLRYFDLSTYRNIKSNVRSGKTCYSNWTYSKRIDALVFAFLFYFNFDSINKLAQKWIR